MTPRPERLLLPVLLLVMGILMLNEGNEIAARESMIARDPRVVQARMTEVDVRERDGHRDAPDTYTLHVSYAFEAMTPSGHTTPIFGTTWLKTRNRLGFSRVIWSLSTIQEFSLPSTARRSGPKQRAPRSSSCA